MERDPAPAAQKETSGPFRGHRRSSSLRLLASWICHRSFHRTLFVAARDVSISVALSREPPLQLRPTWETAGDCNEVEARPVTSWFIPTRLVWRTLKPTLNLVNCSVLFSERILTWKATGRSISWGEGKGSRMKRHHIPSVTPSPPPGESTECVGEGGGFKCGALKCGTLKMRGTCPVENAIFVAVTSSTGGPLGKPAAIA